MMAASLCLPQSAWLEKLPHYKEGKKIPMPPHEDFNEYGVPTVNYSLATTLHPLRNRSIRRINYTTVAAGIVAVFYVLSLIFFH